MQSKYENAVDVVKMITIGEEQIQVTKRKGSVLDAAVSPPKERPTRSGSVN